MSQTRHRITPERAPIVRGLAMGLPAGFSVSNHAHDWSQFIHATAGAMEVRAVDRVWVVPPGRGLRVPAGVAHSIRCVGRVDLRTIYFPPGVACGHDDRITVVPVSPLLRELIVHTIERAPLCRGVAEHEHLAAVLVDLLAVAEGLRLDLPWPSDPRAVAIARHIWSELADPASISDLARRVRTSGRTLERLFSRETGLPLGRWRRQARLLAAVIALASGRSVTDVAFDVGYESTSAFVAMFHRELGVTPGSLA